jgi:hypothetical protein
LKNGQTPQPGPPKKEGDEDDELTRELLSLDVKPQPIPRTSSNVPSIPTNQNQFTPVQPTNYPQNTFGQPTNNLGWQGQPQQQFGMGQPVYQPPPQQQVYPAAIIPQQAPATESKLLFASNH